MDAVQLSTSRGRKDALNLLGCPAWTFDRLFVSSKTVPPLLSVNSQRGVNKPTVDTVEYTLASVF